MEVIEKNGAEEELLQTRLDKWLDSVHAWHEHFIWSPNQKSAWTPLSKPLSECRVALVTTGGVHLKSQEAFDVASDWGDWTFREIPFDVSPGELMISDVHYDHSGPDMDINCLLPLSHLIKFGEEGFVGSVAKTHYGFMGFIMDPDKLIHETAPEVARRLLADNVDVVFMTPGCAVCHHTIGLIQNVLEEAGLVTMCMTLKPEVTHFMHIPRAAYVRYPYGYPLGPAFQPELQREIMRKSMELINEIQEPETIVKLPYRWMGSRDSAPDESADPRTLDLINHAEQMMELLQGIYEDMQVYQKDEEAKSAPSRYKLNFYKSQAQRAEKLSKLLEEEVVYMINGLRNLSGPIKYLREEK
ncbi:MAG: D-proline reductase (dithiol) PrdB [Chloroflexota bacterium]|nr:D-proline reductase (dithiol) PrdB [Chloroflexota bacterium]